MALFRKNQVNADKSPRSTIAVRMEAIGGQGANSAGKILAEAAVLKCGFTGNHFSSFGSEKRGAPVRSYSRFSPKRDLIRSATAIAEPDVLVVFHENLMLSHAEVFDGISSRTDLIVNSAKRPRDIRIPSSGNLRSVSTVDATAIALKTGCGLNAVMLGAVVESLPELRRGALRATLGDFFSQLPQKIQDVNLKGFDEGLRRVRVEGFHRQQAVLSVLAGPLPEVGYMNAPLGGLVINPGSTVLKDNSTSRKGVAPLLNRDLCFNCGLCDMVCPDFCFVWEAALPPGQIESAAEPVGPRLLGIDYQYCKGCQKCVVACPVDALTPVLESAIGEFERTHRLFPDITRDRVRERWQSADWAKQASELSAEFRMLTLQTELLDHRSYIRPNLSYVKKPENKK